jgi:hypothetical protein
VKNPHNKLGYAWAILTLSHQTAGTLYFSALPPPEDYKPQFQIALDNFTRLDRIKIVLFEVGNEED